MASLLTVNSAAFIGPTDVLGQFETTSISVVQVGVNVAAVAGTSPSMQLYFEILGADGVWYAVWKPTAVTAAGQQITTLGPGCATAAVLGVQARLRAVISGTTPSFTLSADVHGH